MKLQGIQNSPNNLGKKKNKVAGLTFMNLKAYYKAMIRQCGTGKAVDIEKNRM